MSHIFAEGDRVIVKTRKGKRVVELVGTFQEMVTKARARVVVWDRTGNGAMDDEQEPERVVALTSITPYHNAQDEWKRHEARVAKHAARLYRQGARMFRLGHADGKRVIVETLDDVQGVAFGRVYGRKTIVRFATTDLYPMRY